MPSPTQQGGDDGTRERAERAENREVLEAEASLTDAPAAPEQSTPVVVPEPAPTPTPEPTEAERRLAVLESRGSPARDAGTGRFVATDTAEQTDDGTGAEIEEDPAPEDPPKDEPAPTLPDGVRQGEDGHWYVDLVVDGQPRSQRFDQYQKSAQKYLTGDQWLQEAALARKALNAEIQGGRAPSPGQLPTGAGVNGLPQGGQQGVTPDTFEKAIVDGDPDARQQLAAWVEHQQQPVPVPTYDVVGAVGEALVRRDVDNAIATLSQDEQYGAINAFITSNDQLTDEAQAYSAELRAEGYNDPAVNVQMSVARVRERLIASLGPAIAPARPPAVDPSLTERNDAKIAHARLTAPVGGQSRQPLAPPQPAVPSTKSAIQQMRDARRVV